MPPNESERLGRIEAQVSGIREDVIEIKGGMKEDSKELRDAVKEFTTALANLHEDFLLRKEAEKMAQARDKERDETKSEIGKLEKRVSRLERWRSWLSGGLGVVLFLCTLLVALVREGVIK